MAMEDFDGVRASVGPASDVWSLGATLGLLLGIHDQEYGLRLVSASEYFSKNKTNACQLIYAMAQAAVAAQLSHWLIDLSEWSAPIRNSSS